MLIIPFFALSGAQFDYLIVPQHVSQYLAALADKSSF